MMSSENFWEKVGNRNQWQAGGTTEAPDFVNRIQYFFRHRLMLRHAMKDVGVLTTVLEIGPGSGIFARKLLDNNTNIRYYAIDISESMCRATYAHIPEAKAVIQAQSHQLPFKDASFDLCVSMGGLTGTLYSNKEHALQETFRVLSENGYLIADEKIADTNPYDNLLHHAKWRQLIEEAGFYITTEYHRRYMWPFRLIKRIAHHLYTSDRLDGNQLYYLLLTIATLISIPLEIVLTTLKLPVGTSHIVFVCQKSKEETKEKKGLARKGNAPYLANPFSSRTYD